MNIYQPLFKEKDITNKLCDIYGLKKNLEFNSNLIIKDSKTSYLIIGENYFIILIYLFNENNWRLIIRNLFKIFIDIKTKLNYFINVEYSPNSINIKLKNNDLKNNDLKFNNMEENLFTILFDNNIISTKYFNFVDKIKKFYLISKI